MSTLKQAMLNMESGPSFSQKVKKRSCNFRVTHSNVTANSVLYCENASKNLPEINNIWLIHVAVKTEGIPHALKDSLRDTTNYLDKIN